MADLRSPEQLEESRRRGREANPHPKPNYAEDDPRHHAVLRRCDNERCGRPQEGAGHPRKGWVEAKKAGETVKRWWCSWDCLSRGAVVLALRGE